MKENKLALLGVALRVDPGNSGHGAGMHPDWETTAANSCTFTH